MKIQVNDRKINLNNIAVVLNRPRYPENIGAAARAIMNMGSSRLIVVDPENFDIVKILKMATHAASDIVKSIKMYDTLQEALQSFSYVVGTTARLGGERQVVGNPSEIAAHLIPISAEIRLR
ncbi:MAG: RNA methyltransferase [Desulfobacteraceae bacterium]|nr:RNA methyltransferase [Desulfobacteraceae bacterium]